MLQYLIIILVTLTDFSCEFEFNICRIGAEGKCYADTMTMLDTGSPKNDSSPILSVIVTNNDACSTLCTWNADCLMAWYREDSGTCQLNRRISYNRFTSSTSKIFRWICCKSSGNYNSLSRCPGFWTFNPKNQSDNKIRSSDPVLEFRGIEFFDCQMECLNNPICGAINYFSQDVIKTEIVNCQLIIQFPVESLKFKNSDSWSTFQWQCAHDYRLPNPPIECKEREKSSPGHWTIQNTGIPLDRDVKHLIYFYTMDYRQCLSNCELYSKCKTAWYSIDGFLCILEAENGTACSDKTSINNYNFTTYIWKNCAGPTTRVNYCSPHSTCRMLMDNTNVYISPITCGNVTSSLSNVYQCWDNPVANRGTVYSNNVHCQRNQSFRVFDELKPSSSMFKQFSKVKWLRAYTGYDTFWLINVTDSNFPLVDDENCAIYDSKKTVADVQSLRIIRRTEWFSPKPDQPQTPFSKKPVPHVVITDTEVPFCNCFSVEACSSIMRTTQHSLQPTYSSIPSNFVVTGDGVVYEARGWDFQTAAVGPKYNRNSFVIALCGQYREKPKAVALVSVKKLIQLAVELKKVSGNYTLYIYNDIRDRVYPYDGLRSVIQLWPHYRGHTIKDCRPISIGPVCVSVFSTILCSVILVTVVHCIIWKLWHNQNCWVIRRGRIETMYGNVSDKSVEILPQILLKAMRNLNVEENFVALVTSPIYFIKECPRICEKKAMDQCGCMSSIFAMLDLWRMQCNLVNVGNIAIMADISGCPMKTVFIFQRHAELGNGYFLILHLSCLKSVKLFATKLHQNKCLCDVFNLTAYNPRFEQFCMEWSCADETTYTETKLGNIVEMLQQKYTFNMDTNRNLRYYN